VSADDREPGRGRTPLHPDVIERQPRMPIERPETPNNASRSVPKAGRRTPRIGSVRASSPVEEVCRAVGGCACAVSSFWSVGRRGRRLEGCVLPMSMGAVRRMTPGTGDREFERATCSRSRRRPSAARRLGRVQAAWATTVTNAPAKLVHAHVEDEWWLADTLRHLVLATDAWLRGGSWQSRSRSTRSVRSSPVRRRWTSTSRSTERTHQRSGRSSPCEPSGSRW
jgi:hypothetical protein